MESKYERIRRVGTGSYGSVFKCENRQTGQIVAIKRYTESDSDPIIRKIATREVRMLRQLKHPNLINLIEVFRRKRRLHLVFDYCELTLLDVIEKYSNQCPLALIKKVIWQTVNAVSYCHSQNCIHRDIKPENILICQSGIVKLCDFGFARSLGSSSRLSTTTATNNTTAIKNNNKPLNIDSNNNNKQTLNDQTNQTNDKQQTRQALTEYVATRWYRAPELLIGDVYYGSKIDIWAIGCVTCELMRGEPMWPAKTDFEQLLLIKNSLGNLTEKQSLTLITQGLYDQVSTERLLVQHSIISDPLDRKIPSRVGKLGLEFVSMCLKLDDNFRAAGDTLLKHPFIAPARLPQYANASLASKSLNNTNSNNNNNKTLVKQQTTNRKTNNITTSDQQTTRLDVIAAKQINQNSKLVSNQKSSLHQQNQQQVQVQDLQSKRKGDINKSIEIKNNSFGTTKSVINNTGKDLNLSKQMKVEESKLWTTRNNLSTYTGSSSNNNNKFKTENMSGLSSNSTTTATTSGSEIKELPIVAQNDNNPSKGIRRPATGQTKTSSSGYKASTNLIPKTYQRPDVLAEDKINQRIKLTTSQQQSTSTKSKQTTNSKVQQASKLVSQSSAAASFLPLIDSTNNASSRLNKKLTTDKQQQQKQLVTFVESGRRRHRREPSSASSGKNTKIRLLETLHTAADVNTSRRLATSFNETMMQQ